MWDFLKKMRRFDAYPKTLEDVRIQTYTGGAITIISIIIMNLLFWSEFLNYVTPDITEELFVDTSRSPKIQINLDFVIPKISCDFLALDAMDSSGEQHLEMDHNIYKRRLDLDGKPIADPDKVNITVSKNTTQSNNKTECGSCYGAADRCCNTCEDVKEAYREKKWALDNIETIEQCKNEKYSEKLKTAFLQGCQIYGSLIVNRVSGSFHIAPGESFSVSHLHVHDVQPFSSNDFNTSHRIRHLSFGDRIESHTHNPLKDLEVYAKEGSTMFQYYIKIVPTAYIRKDGSIISSNQYSVTKHQKVVSMISGESGMPGIFFQYELSPLMVKYTEKERSFGHFITNLCAIIGGVYTVAGLLDTLVYYFVKMMQRNTALGKFS